MKETNLDRIEDFGEYHGSMNDDAANKFMDERDGRLVSYHDMRMFRRWALPLIPPESRAELSVLDVGAGTGRMSRRLCKVARRCVAIEPYLPFFERLKASCPDANMEFHSSTLQEYAEIADEPFDFIFLSGVLNYHDDTEVVDPLGLERDVEAIGACVDPGLWRGEQSRGRPPVRHGEDGGDGYHAPPGRDT
jgi:SAM-dependent methyltransferase